MSNVPANLKYSSSHEWVLDQGNGVVMIGITDHAQALLGDLVFVELPEIGALVATGDECGVVESVKAASDLYAPLAGEIFEINHDLEAQPELVNTDPYAAGWIFKMKLDDVITLGELLSPEDYDKLVASEA